MYGVSLCSQYRLPQEGEGVAGACSCTDSLQKINHFETLTTFTLILPVWVAVWACPYLPISWKRKMENACNYGTSQWDSAAAVDLFVIICSNVLYRGFQMNNYFSNHQIPISVCLCLCLCVFVCSCVRTAMEGDGEVIISPVLNCSHCESGECHETKDSVVCYCEDDLILAQDRVSCINSTGQTSSDTALCSK